MTKRDDELERDVKRMLRRVGIRPRPMKTRPNWIGSADGPSDFSENMEKYKREAADHAYADAFGRKSRRPKV